MYYADRKYHLFYSGDALDYCTNQNSIFELSDISDFHTGFFLDLPNSVLMSSF